MRTRLLWVGWLIACASPGPALLAQEAPQGSRRGDHFRVISDDPRLAEEALATVEAVWPVAAALYDLPEGRLDPPLDVHLHRTAEAYRAADQRLTGGDFQRNLAFAHHATRSAHVAVQPPLSDDALARVGLPLLTRILLCHEASHLVRFHVMPNYASHPGWLVDGAAQWIRGRAVAARGGVAGTEADPLKGTDIVRVQRLFARGEAPAAAAILRDETNDLPFYERYAIRQLFFEHLVDDDPALVRRIFAEARRLGGGPDFAERLLARVEAVLGPERLAGLDGAFRSYVEALAPEWEEVYRSLEVEEADWTQLAFSTINALAWRTAPVGRRSYAIAGELELLPGDRHQLNVVLDRSEAGFVQVALAAGSVTVFDYRAQGNVWRSLAHTRCAGLAVGEPVAFRVAVAEGTVSVAVGGEAVLAAEVPGRDLDGPWGVGALRGSAGIWRGVGLE